LQCVAVCCSVLQCVAESYSVLRCVAVCCCSTLQCVVVVNLKGPFPHIYVSFHIYRSHFIGIV